MRRFKRKILLCFCSFLLRLNIAAYSIEKQRSAMGKSRDEDMDCDDDFSSSDNSSKSDIEMSLSDMEKWKELFGTEYIHDGVHLFHRIYNGARSLNRIFSSFCYPKLFP